jgi:hypothetical protein
VDVRDARSVSIAGSSGAKDGWVDVDVVDFSLGGVGMISLVFFPRRVRLCVQLLGTEPGSSSLVDLTGRVQRVCMTDRRPAYLIGMTVDEPKGPQRVAVERLLAALSDGAAPLSREVRRG